MEFEDFIKAQRGDRVEYSIDLDGIRKEIARKQEVGEPLTELEDFVKTYDEVEYLQYIEKKHTDGK